MQLNAVAGGRPPAKAAVGPSARDRSSSRGPVVDHVTSLPPSAPGSRAASHSRRGQAGASVPADFVGVAAIPSILPNDGHATQAEAQTRAANDTHHRSHAALSEEHEHISLAHRKRMAELDGIRRLLETRAGEVEAAHRTLEQERVKLHGEYESKIVELAEAKSRLERQVAKMEAKETQLRKEWGRFEEEKGAAIAEAEVSTREEKRRQGGDNRYVSQQQAGSSSLPLEVNTPLFFCFLPFSCRPIFTRSPRRSRRAWAWRRMPRTSARS